MEITLNKLHIPKAGHQKEKIHVPLKIERSRSAPETVYLAFEQDIDEGNKWKACEAQVEALIFFQESLIAFILSRIWRWTAASGMPDGLSLLHGPVPAPRYLYLHEKLCHCLTPLLILPQHLIPPAFSISHPRTYHQMRGVLRCPTITYTPLLLALANLP